MGRQELLQPCSSRCARSVSMGHDAVLTPLGQGTDGDRPFPTSQPSELCSPRMRRFTVAPSSGCFCSLSAWTMPWQERGEEGRAFKAHFGCQCSEQRTLNWSWSDTWAAGRSLPGRPDPLQSMLLELGANPNSSSVRAGEKGMRAEPCPATGSSPRIFPQVVSKLVVTPGSSHQFFNSAEVQGGVGGVFQSKTQTVNLFRLCVPSLRE